MSQTQELPGEFSKYEEEEEGDISKPVGFIVMGAINFEVKRGCNKIGRDSQTCSIIINSKTVSKVHSVIECEGRDDIFIYDNGSTNKTFLGKKPLKPHCRYKLEHGNSLTFGDVSVTFFLIKGDSKSTCLENNQQPSDDVHGIETQLNNIPSNIFDAETQLDISQDINVARKNNKTLLQIPRIKMIPQPSTSNHQTFFNSKTITTETLPGKFSNTLIASTSKHHKTIALPVSRKSYKNHLTSNSSRIHPQVYVVDEIMNPDIFSMETQCHMNSISGLKSDLKSTNLIDKENAHFVLNKPEIITSTPTDTKVLIPDSENFLEKSLNISNHQQSQSSEKGTPAEVINNQNEELIINDEKLIQSFEDNFFLEDHEGRENNVESLHNSHQMQYDNNKMVTLCEKNQENQNSDFKMNEEPKTLCNSADSGLPSGQYVKASLKPCSSTALSTDNLQILKETSCFDGAANISKNPNSSSVEKKSLTNNCKETCSPRSQKIIGDDNDEPNESSQSFLEITLEEDFKEPMSSPVPGFLVKKLNVEMTTANNDPNSSSDGIKMKPKSNANEMTDSTVPFKVNKISSGVTSPNKIDNCKVPTSQLSNQVHADQFYTTSTSLFFCSSSPDNSQDFIDTKHFHSQRLKEDFADNSEIAETILHQDRPKVKSTPVTPTKDCGSCVPESSDEDSTLSDLEIIEDSPYVNRIRPIYQPSLVRAVNDPFKQKQKFSSLRDNYVINPIKPCVKVEPKNDDDDDDEASDSSYVFDVVNESEKVRLKNSSPRNNLYIMSSSDSDTSDIIGVTPPGNRFTKIKPNSLRFPSVMESIQKTVNNQSKYSPARQSDTESSDSYGFHSVKIPSPRSLEASLLRIMQKRNEAKADVKNDEPKAGIVQSAQYPSVSEKSSELLRKHEETEMGNLENYIGKRNRALDNFGGHVPPKKSRTNDAIEIDLNFWNVDADSESENPEPELCKAQKQDQSRTDNIIGHAEVSPHKDKQKSSGKNHCSLDEKLQECISLFTRSKSKLGKQNPSVRYEDMKSGIGAASVENVKNAEMKNTLGMNQPADEKGKKVCRRSLRFPNVPLKEKKTCNFPSKLKEDANNEWYFGTSGVAVAFTGLDSETLERIIEDLGGTKTEDLNSSQVLVTDQVRRTVKFLCAIGLSKPIASPEWLLASKERGKFLNPWNFILKCDESEEKWKFDLSSTLEKSKRKKLLEGFQVFATQNVRPPVCDILYIVECCGGIPLREKPETWTKHTIVLSCLEDKKWWPPWKFRSVKIVHYEFILSGVLQQNLDFKTYKLR